jgi:hypothetical protein
MRRLAALALAAACGCTPLEWVRPDTSPEQFQADLNDCRARAWQEASVRSWSYVTPMAPVYARDASGRGFFVWPSTPLADPYGHQLMEESRLTQFCMESKGYALQPAAKP